MAIFEDPGSILTDFFIGTESTVAEVPDSEDMGASILLAASDGLYPDLKQLLWRFRY